MNMKCILSLIILVVVFLNGLYAEVVKNANIKLNKSEQKIFDTLKEESVFLDSRRKELNNQLNLYYMVNFKNSYFKERLSCYTKMLSKITKELVSKNDVLKDSKKLNKYVSLLAKQYRYEALNSKTFLINLRKSEELRDAPQYSKIIDDMIKKLREKCSFTMTEQNQLTAIEIELTGTRELKNYQSFYATLNLYNEFYTNLLPIVKKPVNNFLKLQTKLLPKKTSLRLKFLNLANEDEKETLFMGEYSRNMQNTRYYLGSMMTFFELKIFVELLKNDKYKDNFLIFLRNNDFETNELFNLLLLFRKPLKNRFEIDLFNIKIDKRAKLDVILEYFKELKGKVPSNEQIDASFEGSIMPLVTKFIPEDIAKKFIKECYFEANYKKALYKWQCMFPNIELDRNYLP